MGTNPYPEADRILWWKLFLDGMAPRAIAKKWGCSETTVRHDLFRNAPAFPRGLLFEDKRVGQPRPAPRWQRRLGRILNTDVMTLSC
jgi:hypothetical protein